jgi:hypothetical protein
MAIQTIQTTNNPFTGAFGNGQVRVFTSTTTWTVPAGISNVRVRLWGAGGSGISSNCGAGGGFALRSFSIAGVTSVAITVAPTVTLASGGTSSFGSYVSATGGGSTNSSAGGIGIGGDINTQGGTAGSANGGGGGGAASVMGNGGAGGGNANTGFSSRGGAGGGAGSGTTSNGGNGFIGIGALSVQTSGVATTATSGLQGNASIDFIGMGGGGSGSALGNHGNNGGGGGSGGTGGFPAGGSSEQPSSPGLVIVEW